MDNKPLRFAIVGCGRIARKHLDAINSTPNTSLVALCDIASEAIAAFTHANKINNSIRHYTHFEELLVDPNVDAVSICTPSGLHASMALAALERNKHVLVEKPMALSMGDVFALTDAAEKSEATLAVCHQNRFNAPIRALHQAIVHGELGDIKHVSVQVRWHRDQAYYDQASWRGTWVCDGGALMNQGIHAIDILRWLLGNEISQVTGQISNHTHPSIEVEDTGLALVTTAQGATGMIEVSTAVYPKNLEERLSVFGSLGTVVIGGLSMNSIETWDVIDQSISQERLSAALNEVHQDVYGLGHAAIYRDLVHAIREHRTPAIDVNAGGRAVELVLALYQAALKNAPVSLPLDQMSTNAMEGFFLAPSKKESR